MRKQLRLSGSGGQGVITAAIILAAAAVDEGKEAVQSQSYGPEARGGASKSEVIIDDAPIYHPHVIVPDLVLAMTQKAADKYYKDLNPDGLLVLDEQLVPNVPDFPHVVRIPITKIAVEKVGKPPHGHRLLRRHQESRRQPRAAAHRRRQHESPRARLGSSRC